MNTIAPRDEHGRTRGFPCRRQRQRIEHFGVRGGAVQTTDAFKQTAHARHLRFALAGTRGRDRSSQLFGGLRLRVGQHACQAALDGRDGFDDLRLSRGVDLRSHILRRALPFVGASRNQRVGQMGAVSRLRICHPGL